MRTGQEFGFGQCAGTLVGDGGATVAVAYGEIQGVTLSTRGAHGPMGLSFESLLAVGGILGGFDDEAETGGPAGQTDETPAGPQA